MSTAPLAIEGLSKRFAPKKGEEIDALRNVSMRVEAGQICALLGENGAGKSTLIGIVAGVVLKTSGKVFCNGWDIDSHHRQAKQSMGIVPQDITMDPFFSPYALVSLVSGMHGIRKRDRDVLSLLERLGLRDKARAYARRLSGGMIRRLMVAKAMVHRPPLLVLDEPTAGVDVLLRRQLWEYVKELNDEGVAVLLTTHYLEEAEKLAEKIIILDKGQVIADTPKAEIMRLLDVRTIEVEIDAVDGVLFDQLTVAFQGLPEVRLRATAHPQRVRIEFPPSLHNAGEMINILYHKNFAVIDLKTTEPDLEELFIHLTQASS